MFTAVKRCFPNFHKNIIFEIQHSMKVCIRIVNVQYINIYNFKMERNYFPNFEIYCH